VANDSRASNVSQRWGCRRRKGPPSSKSENEGKGEAKEEFDRCNEKRGEGACRRKVSRGTRVQGTSRGKLGDP
jgi:hypothetical protein